MNQKLCFFPEMFCLSVKSEWEHSLLRYGDDVVQKHGNFFSKNKITQNYDRIVQKIDFCFTYMAVDVTSLRSSSSYVDVIFVTTQQHPQQQEHNSNSFFFLSEGPTTTPQKL